MTPIAAQRWRVAALLSGVAMLAAVVFMASTHAQAPEATPGTTPTPAAVVPSPAGEDSAPVPKAPPTANVRIVFRVSPAVNATVNWGKKKLGVVKPKAALVVHRPRDSGPLDVMVRSPGYLPVHTRAYTFTDTTVAVKMTPLDKKNTLYGYREEIPPDGGVPGAGTPDGGVP